MSEYPWEENVFYFANQWLIQMPDTNADVSTVSSITLNVTMNLPSYATIGIHTLVVGFSESVSTPSETVNCPVYIDDTTKQITLNVRPTVDISRAWYIYIYDAGYAQGYLHSIDLNEKVKACVAQYWDGSKWQECAIEYYAGNGTWLECDAEFMVSN